MDKNNRCSIEIDLLSSMAYIFQPNDSMENLHERNAVYRKRKEIGILSCKNLERTRNCAANKNENKILQLSE